MKYRSEEAAKDPTTLEVPGAIWIYLDNTVLYYITE